VLVVESSRVEVEEGKGGKVDVGSGFVGTYCGGGVTATDVASWEVGS
jgi:hypothetical protein